MELYDGIDAFDLIGQHLTKIGLFVENIGVSTEANSRINALMFSITARGVLKPDICESKLTLENKKLRSDLSRIAEALHACEAKLAIYEAERSKLPARKLLSIKRPGGDACERG